MEKTGKLLLETILLAGLVFGATSSDSQQNALQRKIEKKIEYVACILQGNERDNVESIKKYVSEKLKEYEVSKIKPFISDTGKKDCYEIWLNIYDKSMNKSQVEKTIEDKIGHYCEVWGKKEYDNETEVKEAYKNIALSLASQESNTAASYFNDKVLDWNSGKKFSIMTIKEKLKKIYNATAAKEKFLKKDSKYEIFSDYRISVQKCERYYENFKDICRYYKPKDGDYRASGPFNLKVNGKIQELNGDFIFRKINGRWKIVATAF